MNVQLLTDGLVLGTEVMDGAVTIDGVKVYIDPAKFDSTRYLSAPPTPTTTKRYAHLIEEAARVNLAKVTPGLLRRKKA